MYAQVNDVKGNIRRCSGQKDLPEADNGRSITHTVCYTYNSSTTNTNTALCSSWPARWRIWNFWIEYGEFLHSNSYSLVWFLRDCCIFGLDFPLCDVETLTESVVVVFVAVGVVFVCSSGLQVFRNSTPTVVHAFLSYFFCHTFVTNFAQMENVGKG